MNACMNEMHESPEMRASVRVSDHGAEPTEPTSHDPSPGRRPCIYQYAVSSTHTHRIRDTHTPMYVSTTTTSLDS